MLKMITYIVPGAIKPPYDVAIGIPGCLALKHAIFLFKNSRHVFLPLLPLLNQFPFFPLSIYFLPFYLCLIHVNKTNGKMLAFPGYSSRVSSTNIVEGLFLILK